MKDEAISSLCLAEPKAVSCSVGEGLKESFAVFKFLIDTDEGEKLLCDFGVNFLQNEFGKK